MKDPRTFLTSSLKESFFFSIGRGKNIHRDGQEHAERIKRERGKGKQEETARI